MNHPKFEIPRTVAVLAELGFSIKLLHHATTPAGRSEHLVNVTKLLDQATELIKGPECPLELKLMVDAFDGREPDSNAMLLVATLVGLYLLQADRSTVGYAINVSSLGLANRMLPVRLALSALVAAGFVTVDDDLITLKQGLVEGWLSLPAWLPFQIKSNQQERDRLFDD